MQSRVVRSISGRVLSAGLALGAAGCGLIGPGPPPAPARAEARPVKAPPPPAPRKPPVRPIASDSSGRVVLRAANLTRGSKIMVSLKDRWLWYVVGRDTALSVPVAVGKSENFEYNGRKFRFETPVGRRKVLKKEPSPIWTVPEWHYMEKAAERGLELVRLQANARVKLSDGSFLVVRGQDVGRINQFGNFWPFTPGTEIVFDNKIFMPPNGTRQRRVPDALGPYKLDTGDGYLIHGTHLYNAESVGQAVSHGCVRMDNDDLVQLYRMVSAGTPVFIF